MPLCVARPCRLQQGQGCAVRPAWYSSVAALPSAIAASISGLRAKSLSQSQSMAAQAGASTGAGCWGPQSAANSAQFLI